MKKKKRSIEIKVEERSGGENEKKVNRKSIKNEKKMKTETEKKGIQIKKMRIVSSVAATRPRKDEEFCPL